MTKSSTDQSSWLVGRNSQGRWIVRDHAGRRGGMFVSCSAAIGYARIVTGHRTPSVVMVSGTLELDMAAA